MAPAAAVRRLLPLPATLAVLALAALAALLALPAAAYVPGYTAGIGTAADDVLVGHDIHPTSGLAAVLHSSAIGVAPCRGLRARRGARSGCGGVDLKVAILNSPRNGRLVRQFSVGTPSADEGLAIAWLPAANQLYILGRSDGQHWIAVVSQFGALVRQIFIGNPDPAGRTLRLNTIAFGRDGDLFFGGQTTASVSLTGCRKKPASRTDWDVVVCRAFPGGFLKWCSHIGLAGSESMPGRGASGIAFDGHGNIYVTGSTTSWLGGNVPLGGGDVFASKLDSNGNIMWSRLVGSRARDVPAGIAVDTYSDTVYVGGTTYGAVAGDYSRGGGDIFISQLNAADGRILWNRQYGGPGTETMSDIVVYHQRIFIAGVYPSGRGLWTSYWAEGDSPDVPKNVPNGGLRKYYSMEIYGGNDVFVCELTNVGEAQTGVPTDWTRVPDGMIKWCSTYGSPGDDVASSLRIFDYHMSFPWLASGVAYTNDAYTIAPRGGRDTIYTLYWEYDIPGFGRTERTDPFAPTGPVVCPAR